MSNKLMNKLSSMKSSAKSSKMAPTMVVMPKSRESREWEAKEALHILTRADEIRENKSLMKDVEKHAKSQINTLKKIC